MHKLTLINKSPIVLFENVLKAKLLFENVLTANLSLINNSPTMLVGKRWKANLSPILTHQHYSLQKYGEPKLSHLRS